MVDIPQGRDIMDEAIKAAIHQGQGITAVATAAAMAAALAGTAQTRAITAVDIAPRAGMTVTASVHHRDSTGRRIVRRRPVPSRLCSVAMVGSILVATGLVLEISGCNLIPAPFVAGSHPPSG